jgi:hypothetical protein
MHDAAEQPEIGPSLRPRHFRTRPHHANRSSPERTFRLLSRGILGVAVIAAGTGGGLLGVGLFESPSAASTLVGSPTPIVASPSSVADATTIAADVDSAIVDVTTTLADDEGTAAGTGMVIRSGGDILTTTTSSKARHRSR